MQKNENKKEYANSQTKRNSKLHCCICFENLRKNIFYCFMLTNHLGFVKMAL